MVKLFIRCNCEDDSMSLLIMITPDLFLLQRLHVFDLSLNHLVRDQSRTMDNSFYFLLLKISVRYS